MELTKKELEWFESLENVVKKMPRRLELVVHEQNCNRDTGVFGSVFFVCKKGMTHKSQEESGDLMEWEPDLISLDQFVAWHVCANNHGY